MELLVTMGSWEVMVCQIALLLLLSGLLVTNLS